MFILSSIGFWLIGLAIGASPINMTLPMEYITDEQQTLETAHTSHVAVANLDCAALDNAVITVCAELPNNWRWKPERGVVYMNIYNNIADISKYSNAKWSTGRPGSTKAPTSQCLSISKWIGGNMYIQIDPDHYYPITYSLSVLVTPTTVPSADNTLRQVETLPMVMPNGATTPKIQKTIYLLPTALTHKSLQLNYDTEMLVRLEVCIDKTRAPPTIETALLAEYGALTVFLCDRTPCYINSANVKCSVETPLPVSTCSYRLSPGQEDSYMYLHAAGGEDDPSSGKYIAKFNIGVTMK